MTREEKIKRIYDTISINNNLIEGLKGFPVMIGDVLQWVKKRNAVITIHGKIVLNTGQSQNLLVLLGYWGDYREPIESQSEQTIDFIGSLMKND